MTSSRSASRSSTRLSADYIATSSTLRESARPAPLTNSVSSLERGILKLAPMSGEGEVLWEVPLPGRVSEPTFADVDGDGLGEVLVTCGDGSVYCLGR